MALTRREAEIVAGMIARGDKHHDIAAFFGENQARIAEVENGSMYGHLPPAKKEELPPKGAPGPKGRRLRAFAAKALRLIEEGDQAGAISALKEGLAAYDRTE